MPKLLVYLHLAMKQRALQSSLGSALGSVDVTAVGRIADFDRALSTGQDAVLSLPVVLGARGMDAKLQGQRQGSSDEPYVLVSADRIPNPATASSVGALDLLGRSGTVQFVHGLLGASPRVERVTKVEDLLPLLQMQRAECICLPARLFSEIKGVSRMNLLSTELKKKVGLPAVSTVGPNGGAVLTALKGLSTNAARVLGVDGWR